MNVALCTATTTELNHIKDESFKSRSHGLSDTKDVVMWPPCSSSSVELVENDAFGASLGPITPDSNRESVDCCHLGSTSPMSLPSPGPSKALCFGSPCTPRKDVFDPFAPGPDKLMRAPYSKKYVEESRFSVARRLKFESFSESAANSDCGNYDKINDQMIFEAVYSTILEAINGEDIVKASHMLPDTDLFKTPTSAPHLSGVADTCPPSPLKPSNKLRSIDKDICRRLEF